MSLSLRSHSLLAKSLFFITLICTQITVDAKEGMWIPATLKAREKDMKALGLEIPVERIYNENGTGLNNAVVLFGKGCTGEIISSKGLVLTNHHCGYGSVQGLSSTEKDYFANGFFAQSQSEELPVPGLTVTFIRRMENVTERILAGTDNSMNPKIRDSVIAANIKNVENEFVATTKYEALIKPYFNGNQYWVAIMETFRDIRLVGFPPNGIGAFGGDVENWMWPRHTGDFSLFRVYAGADNKPADYAATNKPYKPAQFFNINISGYKENDFTMVYGFPGTTQEYISSYELRHVSDITDPISIEARTRKLDIWSKHMSWSRATYLKYTSKRAGVANGWKKWQGEVMGLSANNVTGIKEAYEKEFQKWAEQETTIKENLLIDELRAAGQNLSPLVTADQYIKECPLAVELIAQGAVLDKFIGAFRLGLSNEQLTDTLKKLATAQAGFFKNYDAPTDKDVFISLMQLYFSKSSDMLPEYYLKTYRSFNQDLNLWADNIYNTSLLTSFDKLFSFVQNATPADSTKMINDPAWQLSNSLATMRKILVTPMLAGNKHTLGMLNRRYMKAQMLKDKNKMFFPDANLTLRVSYGQIKGLDPDGPATYSWQTKLSDVVRLDDSTSDIFKVPAKLKQLYNTKDFGRWAVNGDVPVAFTASNHTSGGNSGSPVLNSKGELIGTNFDRAYEGTMSDYYFDPTRCRNISVDIRYTLFVIEKFGNAGWLIDEMKITGGTSPAAKTTATLPSPAKTTTAKPQKTK